MSFFPLLTMGWVFGSTGNGILKGSANKIASIWYNRPVCLEGEPKKYTYVQDLDIGSVTGQFRYVYRGPYYRRYMARIRDSGMGMAVMTDRPSKNVLSEMVDHSIYRDNKVIITNGGSCVWALTDKTASGGARYTQVTDLKLSETSVQELRDVMETISTNGGTRNMPYGAFVINTKDARNTYLPDGTSLFARMRISFGLKRRNVITENGYDVAKNDARNISFEIFPKFSHDFMVKRTSFANIDKKVLDIGTSSKHPFLERWLNSRFIRYIGRYSALYEPADREDPHAPRYMNLPKLRNLIWRHRNTYVDCLNQIDVTKASLLKLVANYDVSTGTWSKTTANYLTDTCVSLSTKGLEFVPIGATKIGALSYVEPPEPLNPATVPNFASLPPETQRQITDEHDAWDRDHRLWETDLTAYSKGPGAERVKDSVINGDNFNDFMQPVSIQDLQTEVFKIARRDFGGDVSKVNIIDVFYKLSKPPEKTKFEDVNKMAIRYNMTGNSLSGISLDMKTAEDERTKALAAEWQENIIKPRQDIINTENRLNAEMTDLENKFRLYHSITGYEYRTKKLDLQKQLAENEEKKTKYRAALPGLMAEGRKKAKAPISTANLKGKGRIATTGREVLDRINERIAPRTR